MFARFSRSIFIFFLLLPFPASSRQGPSPAKLSMKTKTAVVAQVSKALLDYYVFEDTARRMGAAIQQELKKGSYNSITDPVAFADRLLKDLQSVYHDGHLLVQYNPAFDDQPDDTVSGQPPADPLKRLKDANYGFDKAEILNGNIGYLNIKNFWAGKAHGYETMQAALRFVSSGNALIIDVRNCGGGSQETVTLLCGFFLEKRTLIQTFYNRSDKSSTEFWAEPDSSVPGLRNMPLYILTSSKSFSAAEMLPYDLQALKRATVIGEVTGGGAHGTFEQAVGNGFVLSIPYWRGINPVTGTDWEKTGVQPDISTTAGYALEMAEMLVFESLLDKTKDPRDIFELHWQLDLLKAVNHPAEIDEATLKKFAGVYGDRTFTLENGKLFYQRTGRPKFEMEPMTPTMMKGKGNTYFKIEFITDTAGNVNDIKAYYQDNRVETAHRTK